MDFAIDGYNGLVDLTTQGIRQHMSKCILIIEDDDIMLESMAEILRVSRYDVLRATNGQDGLQLAETHQPDLIICDMYMPGMEGWEVLRHIRQSCRTQDTPFLFITGHVARHIEQETLNSGADGYISKPFEVPALLRTIKTLIESR